MTGIETDTLGVIQEKLHLQFKQSAKTLNALSQLPTLLKRDLSELLIESPVKNVCIADKVIGLLQIYERTLKLFSLSQNDPTETISQELIEQLCEEFQFLITELDFDGKIGERLIDIRTRLLLSPPLPVLLELILHTVTYVLSGTREERKNSQAFLMVLNQKIDAIQHCNTVTSNAHQILSKQRVTFHEGLSENFQQLTQMIQQDSDPVRQSELGQIRENLKDLMIESQQLMKMDALFSEQLAQNNEQLEQLQNESLEYRRRLGIQTQKLRLDPLTKIYNRQALESHLTLKANEDTFATNTHCLALIDLDQFKIFNEQFSHLIGDKVLKLVARKVYEHLTENDFVARFSGEEFVVLLSPCDHERRDQLMQKIQHQIASLPLIFRSERLSISVSIGTSYLQAGDQPLAAIDRAGTALAKAKLRESIKYSTINCLANISHIFNS